MVRGAETESQLMAGSLATSSRTQMMRTYEAAQPQASTPPEVVASPSVRSRRDAPLVDDGAYAKCHHYEDRMTAARVMRIWRYWLRRRRLKRFVEDEQYAESDRRSESPLPRGRVS